MEIQFIRRHRGKLVALISIGGAGVGIYYIAKLLRSRIERYVMQKIQSGMLEMGEESKSQAYVVPTVVHFFTRSRTPLSHTPPPPFPTPSTSATARRLRHQQIYGSSVETDFVRATLKSFLKSGLARCAAVGSSRDDLKKVMGLVGVDAKALAAGRATSGGEDDPAADAAVAAAAAASDEAQLLELLQSASIQTDALEAYVRLLRTGSSEGVAGHRFEQWRRVSDVWSMDGGAAPFAFDACQADEMSAAVIRAHALYYANVLRADFPAYSAATKQADGAIARAMAACATRSEQPTRAELRHRVAAGELLKKLITDEVVHHGLARTATSVYAVCVSNAALRVATAVHARRTRPSDGSDTAPAVVVSGATRTEFFSRAQQLSGEDAIARLFHRVWQAVVAEIGTDVDDKATSFFRPIDSDGFTSLITRIRARCEGSKTASHALVAAVVPLFVQQRPASSAPRDGAVDAALVGEMLDEVLDTIEGCVACARACRCAEGLVRRLLHRTLLTPLSFLSLSLSLSPTHSQAQLCARAAAVARRSVRPPHAAGAGEGFRDGQARAARQAEPWDRCNDCNVLQ